MAEITAKIVLLILTASLLGCQQTKPNYDTSGSDKIEAYLLQLHKDGKLNGNVLVLKDNQTIYENSFGYADAFKSTLLNKEYRFNVGSVYKEFPAVAIMQLEEENKINLNDKSSTYLPELPVWNDKITIKHLLQYSSGLPIIPWSKYFDKDINVKDEDIMNGFQEIEKLEFEPGSDYLYSNNNSILLIKVIEKITKSTFKEYIQEEILTPLSMNSTLIKD